MLKSFSVNSHLFEAYLIFHFGFHSGNDLLVIYILILFDPVLLQSIFDIYLFVWGRFLIYFLRTASLAFHFLFSFYYSCSTESDTIIL